MVDFGRARQHMVDSQLRPSNVTDRRILAQMGLVAREDFVAPSRRPVAYVDDVQWLGAAGSGRFMSPPTILAKMIQLGNIRDTDAVLIIGAGTGYSTAVVAGLCSTVVGLESDAGLVAKATAGLADIGLANASMVSGDIAAIGKNLFDVILVEGALTVVPPAFFAALKDGGRLVTSVRSGRVAVANVFVKSGTSVTARAEFDATLPILVLSQPEEQFVF